METINDRPSGYDERDYMKEARAAAEKLNIDFSEEKFNIADLARGIKVEYEHGLVAPATNVTDDDPLKTAKIALAHLWERAEKGGPDDTQYDYYDGLEVLEKSPPGHWRGVRAENYWARYKTTSYLLICIYVIIIIGLTDAILNDHSIIGTEYDYYIFGALFIFATITLYFRF
jgi:hypothetical protein